VFDSEAEYGRFLFLQYLERNGEIKDLQRQVKFEIIPKLVKQVEVKLKTKTKVVERVEEMAAHYTADFTYVRAGGQFVISEVKGGGTLCKLADYVLRRKLIKQLIYKHNQEIGFEDWVFEEYVVTAKRKRKKINVQSNKTTRASQRKE
jgi:hypothetical protein